MLDETEAVETPVVEETSPPATTEEAVLEAPVVEPEVTEEPVQEPELAEAEEVQAEESTEEEPPVEEPEVDPNSSLGQLYMQNDKLKGFLKENQDLKAFWFRAAEINKTFSTPADAERARDQALEFMSFDKHWYGDKDGKREFQRALYENSKDEQGNPQGHYEDFAEMMTGDTLDNLDRGAQQFAQQGGVTLEQYKTAIAIVNASLGRGEKGGSQPKLDSAYPQGDPQNDAVRQRMADMDKRESDLRAQEGRFRSSQSSEFNGRVSSSYDAWLSNEIQTKLEPAKAFLSNQAPFYRDAITKSITAQVEEVMKSDKLFQANLQSLMRSGNRGPEHLSKITKELEQRTRITLPGIVSQVLKQAGSQVMATQEEKAARRRQAEQRREPTTTGSPGRLGSASHQEAKQKPGENYDQAADRILGI